MFTFNVSPGNVTVTVNFSSIVSNISTPSLPSFATCLTQNNSVYSHAITVSGNLLNISLTSGGGYASSMYSEYTENGVAKEDFCFINYDELA